MALIAASRAEGGLVLIQFVGEKKSTEICPASRKKSQPEGFAGFELFLMAQISASWQKSHVGPKSQPFGPNCPNFSF